VGAIRARFATRPFVLATCAVTALVGLRGPGVVEPAGRAPVASGAVHRDVRQSVGQAVPARARRLTETGEGLNNVVACPAPHACVEGGTAPVKRWYQADVVRQTSGGWAAPKVLDGIAALSRLGASGVTGLACPAVGECVAVGYYDRGATTARGGAILLAFVAVESGGAWSPARELPGLGTLAPSRYATVGGVSCGGVGQCAIVGSFRTGRGTTTAYEATESGGAFGPAVALPGLAGGPGSAATSVSCAAPGSCAATGWMVGPGGRADAFASTSSSGTWGPATVLPGMAAISTTGGAAATAVSCGEPGACAVTGTVDETRAGGLAFVDAEVSGAWGTAVLVPGLAARTHAHVEAGLAVSCEPSGTCVAGGYYRRDAGPVVAYLVEATAGTWHTAADVLGPDLRVGSSAAITSLACADAEDCAGAGTFRGRGGGWRTFVVDEVAGAWGDAVPLAAPKTPSDADDAWIGQVACLPGTLSCAAAGYFQPGRGQFTATATTFTPAGPDVESVSPATVPPHGGEVVVVHGTNLAGATSVRVGGVPLTSYDVVNLQTIRFVAPRGHGVELVVVTTPLGGSGASGTLAYQVAPRVTSVTPDHGSLAGGERVVVHGTDLVGTTVVRFGGRRARDVVVVTPDAVRVVIPPGHGAVRVSVTTPEGTSPRTGLRFRYEAPRARRR